MNGDHHEVLDLRREVERLKAKLAQEDAAHSHTIEQRDRAEEAADELAYAIAPVEEIGEHSNANDPWKNALEAVEHLKAKLAEAASREGGTRRMARRFVVISKAGGGLAHRTPFNDMGQRGTLWCGRPGDVWSHKWKARRSINLTIRKLGGQYSWATKENFWISEVKDEGGK